MSGAWSAGGRGPRWLALAALVAATVLVYLPGLNGPLVFDDLPNIVNAPRLRMHELGWQAIVDALYSTHETWPNRGLSYLSFALNHLASGGAFVALHLKLTNVAIHVAAGLVLFWLARRLARRAGPPGGGVPAAGLDGADLLALLVTAVWLLHPLQLTSVLYTVQRMASLSALLVLAGVAVYVAGRERLEAGRRGGLALMVAGVAGGTAVGPLVKENAVLLPAFALLVEIAFFRRDGLARGARLALTALHAVCFGLPALAVLSALVLRFDLVEATYASRDFTPWERLLTQARVLGHYLQMIALPRLSAFGLFHDDVPLSRGLLAPPATAVAVAAWIAVAAATAWGLLRRAPWAFGVAWFLAGHVMESSIIGLELMHEHRNYLPLAGLLLGVAISVRRALVRAGVARRAVVALSVPVLALLAFLTHARADIWSSEPSLVEFAAVTHPRSYRAATYLAIDRVMTGRPLEEVYAAWAHAARLGTSDHTALLELIKLLAFVRTLDLPPQGQACPEAGAIPQRLPDSAECVERLLEASLVEMHRRAREEPIPSTTVVALEHFASCTTGAAAYCAPMRDDVETWVRAVLAGDGMRPRLRPRLTLLLADLRVSAGDQAQALRLAEQATRDSGHGPSFTSQLVGVYLALDEPHKAREAVALMQDPRHWRPGNDAIAQALSGAIDEYQRARDAARR